MIGNNMRQGWTHSKDFHDRNGKAICHSLASQGIKTKHILNTKNMLPQYNIGDVFITSISEFYDNNWGIAEGIRELIQNSYDNAKDVNIGKEGDKFIIEDKGSGIIPDEMTVLGYSAGTGASTYGEGLKIGALVITKYGGEMIVDTYDYDAKQGKVFKVYLKKQTPTSRVRVLHWEQIAETDRTGGTRITISGISDDDILKAKNYMLRYRKDWRPIEERDDLLRLYYKSGVLKFKVAIGEDPKEDFIAINGQITTSDNAQKLETEKSILSYNLLLQKHEDNLDKDFRKEIWTKSKGRLSLGQVIELLSNSVRWTNSKEVVEKILDGFNRNMDRIETRFDYSRPLNNPKLWLNTLHKRYGEKICIASGNTQIDGLAQDKGYQTVSWQGNGKLLLANLGIKTASEVIGQRIIGKYMPYSHLTPEEKQNVYKATKILLRVYNKYSPDGYIEDNKTLLGNINFTDRFEGEATVRGRYDPVTKSITLRRDTLRDLSSTLFVLNEELIHKWFKAHDLSREFQNSLGEQAGTVYNWRFPEVSGRQFDLATYYTKSDIYRKILKDIKEDDVLRLRLIVQKRNPEFKFKAGTKATKSGMLPQMFPYLNAHDLKGIADNNKIELEQKDITEL